MSEQVLDVILQEMRQGFASVNVRLDRVEQRLEVVDQRLEVVDQRLEAVEQRLEVVEQRLEVVEQRLEVVEQRLEVVEQNIVTLNKRASALEDVSGGLRMAVLETRETVDRIEEVQKQHTEALETIRQERKIDRRLLDALTIRYLEQDTAIRESKQA